jgi:3-oxoacyl-(acyl-carrier-protein) synthase
MRENNERRVVITGVGVVAANGIGQQAFWKATSSGHSGIKRIQRFATDDLPVKVAGEVSEFLATDYIERKLVNRTDRPTHLLLATVQEAIKDADLALEKEDTTRVGTVIANTLGGVGFAMDQLESLYVRGPRYLSAYTAIAWLQVANIGQTSIRFGLKGYCKTPVNDVIGGLDAMGLAYRAIRHGAADLLITGGCESFLHPFSLTVIGHEHEITYCVAGDDPTSYRPFDQRAGGLILAEGAGVCILEEYEHALQRNAHIYGEIVGYGQTNDANGPTPPSSNGSQYARAMRLALREGGLTPDALGYVSLDGRALPLSDQGEADALHQVFGSTTNTIPVSVPRTTQGHSFAAAGAIDTITALLALQNRTVPPTINCENFNSDYDINLVRDKAQPLSGKAVLLGGRAIGGANVALAVKRIV